MRRAIALGLVSCLLWVTTSSSAQVIELHKDAQWTLDNLSGFANVTLHNITVPSYVLEVLQGRNITGDPLSRFNEREYSWIAADIWTYTARFTPPSIFFNPPLPTSSRASSRHLLTLHGIDTAASIYLNSILIGNISNAHRRHTLELPRDLLLPRENNVLSLRLYPPAVFAAEQAAAYPYPVPYTKQLGNTVQYNFIRKPASDSGWDWGPNLSPSGLSGGITLQSSEVSILTDVGFTQQHHPNGSVTLKAEAFFLPGTESETGELNLRVRGPISGSKGGKDAKEIKTKGETKDGEIAMDEWNAVLHITIAPEAAVEWASRLVHGDSDTCSAQQHQGSTPGGSLGHVVHTVAVDIPAPQLWWPWDLDPGGQVLYEVTLEYSAAAAQETLSPPQMMSRRIGFRTIEFVTQPTGVGSGETFSFKVNGVPLWARGANVVPLDVIETRVTREKMKSIVAAARAANMNMLRVWGGGRYFQDAFYDACDESGLLVWQEFMFACACYPRDDAFLLDVAEEARQQTLRLASHPSVAVWGGNNENEASLSWFQESKVNRALYAVDFSVLFVDLLRKVVAHIDPHALYLDSSPTNGLYSRQPYVKRWGDVTDPIKGDVHFYDYVNNLFLDSSFPPAKFVSEFGFMSYPSLESFSKEASEDPLEGDMGEESELLKYRMRHAYGLQEIRRQLEMHFGARVAARASGGDWWSSGCGLARPSHSPISSVQSTQSTPRDLWTWLFPGSKCFADPSTLIINKEREKNDSFRRFAYLTQIQQALIYSTAASRWRRGKSDPSVATSGLLYWQLNDIWAGPSWSSINVDGRWKPLHYAAQRFFAPVAVFGFLSDTLVTHSTHNNEAASEQVAKVEAHIVNDLPISIKGSLTVQLIPFRATLSDQVITLVESLEVQVPASSATIAWRSMLHPQMFKDALGQVHDVSTSCFIKFSFTPHTVEGAHIVQNSTINSARTNGVLSSWEYWESIAGPSHSELLLVEPKNADLARVSVEIENSTTKSSRTSPTSALPHSLEVTLRAHGGTALYVVLESPYAGTFSDNMFSIMPWETKKITFLALPENSASIDFSEFQKSLRVTWLQEALTSSGHAAAIRRKTLALAVVCAITTSLYLLMQLLNT